MCDSGRTPGRSPLWRCLATLPAKHGAKWLEWTDYDSVLKGEASVHKNITRTWFERTFTSEVSVAFTCQWCVDGAITAIGKKYDKFRYHTIAMIYSQRGRHARSDGQWNLIVGGLWVIRFFDLNLVKNKRIISVYSCRVFTIPEQSQLCQGKGLGGKW